MKNWNEKARDVMKIRNVTIREIADTLGMTPGGVGHYLSGRRHPNPGMLKKIAKRIGVSVSELIEDDPMFARDQVEHDALDALRKIPRENLAAAIAMLRGLAIQEETDKSGTDFAPPPKIYNSG